VGLQNTRDLRITMIISWSSHLVLSRLRTWLTIVLNRLYIACGSSPLLRTNRSSSPLIVSCLVILVTSSPSCLVDHRLEDIPNFFGIFQPLHLIILLPTEGGEEYRSCLGIKKPYLGGLIGVCWGSSSPLKVLKTKTPSTK
jgi:hypothetical protein